MASSNEIPTTLSNLLDRVLLLSRSINNLSSRPCTIVNIEGTIAVFVRERDTVSGLCRAVADIIIDRVIVRYRDAAEGDAGAIVITSRPHLEDPASLRNVVSSVAGGHSYLPDEAATAGLAIIRAWASNLQRLWHIACQALVNMYHPSPSWPSAEDVGGLLASKGLHKEKLIRYLGTKKVVSELTGQSVDDLDGAANRIFDHADLLLADLEQIRVLGRYAQAGISPQRPVRDFAISRSPDAMLEYANLCPPDQRDLLGVPVLRFFVARRILAETSSVFAEIFSRRPQGDAVATADDDDDTMAGPEDDHRPSPHRPDLRWPLPFSKQWPGEDGKTPLQVYSMTQFELNNDNALEILLYAAHMRNEMVPREVSFDRFVAIADVCCRYECTSPLELSVEHRWLPQWVHRSADPMPDGLIIISYAFGLRRIFTSTAKSAILNLRNEAELAARPWPQVVRERIWAVRNVKMAQVYDCCRSAVREYMKSPAKKPAVPIRRQGSPLQPGVRISNQGQQQLAPQAQAQAHTRTPSIRRATYTSFIDSWVSSKMSAKPSSQDQRPTSPTPSSSTMSTLATPATTSSKATEDFRTIAPRCPSGSHECDSRTLGFLIQVFSELQLLPIIFQPDILSHLGDAQHAPSRSLDQLVRELRMIPSAPSPLHPGMPCDPIPGLRVAVNDVYNSVTGLTLFEITGRHGFAMSRHHADEVQPVLRVHSRWSTVLADRALHLERENSQGSGPVTPGLSLDKLPEDVLVRILAMLAVEDMNSAALSCQRVYSAYKILWEKTMQITEHPAPPCPSAGPPGSIDDSKWEEVQHSQQRDDPEANERTNRSPQAEDVDASEDGIEPPYQGPSIDLSHEKFLSSETLFLGGNTVSEPQAKMLGFLDFKQLREEHDVYVGMRRGETAG